MVVPIRAAHGTMISEYLGGLDKSTYKDEYRQILAAGGDGTINICVNAMIKNNIDLPLAIFPAGTANDFAYYFGIPDDINSMIDVALGENLMYADVGKVNNRHFINVAAMGQVVGVSQKTDPTLKNTIGVLAYYLKGMSEIPNLKPRKVILTTPDDVYREKMYFMVVMNGKSAGGFKKISPESEINDGLLDVMLFRSMSVFEMPKVFMKLLKGKHYSSNKVLHFQTSRLRVESLDEYDRLVEFFVENQLEFDGDEEVDTDIVRCYKVTDAGDKLIGGAVLALREGKFIIDGIAVDSAYRKEKIGEKMLGQVLSEVRSRGGQSLYLVARAPGFFRKNGFKAIDPESAPNFFECKYCPQYMVSCHPEVMKYEFSR